MTPVEVETAARNAYNAVGSRFWSEAEIFILIYMAQLELCKKALILERTYTTQTIIGTQEYNFPTYAYAIKKASWYGVPLRKIDLREDDMITANNTASLTQGDPRYYTIYGRNVGLRNTPSSVQPLKIWTYDLPQPVSTLLPLDVPDLYHPDLVYYVLSVMFLKDEKYETAAEYRKLWVDTVKSARGDVQRFKRADTLGYVKDEEQLLDATVFGVY